MQPSSEPIFQFMTPNGNSKQEVRSAAARSAHARARRARMLEYQAADKSKKVEPQDANRELSPLSNSYNLQMSHRASIVLASPVLGYERRDPFGSLAIQCSPFEQYLLDHFTELGMMNGIFLMSCRSLANLYGKKEYHTNALRYKLKCIETVRHNLDSEEQTVSDAMIANVLFLVSDEFHTGNVEGTRSHTEAIGKLVRMRGGLKTLGLEGTLQDLVLWNDRLSTFYTGTRPNFMHADKFVALASTNSLTPGFHRASSNGLFSKDMIQILDDICAVTSSMQTAGSTSPGPELQQDFSSRLLVLSSDHHCPPSPNSYSPSEKCLCLALMVFIKLALRSPTSGASYGPLLGSRHLAIRIQQQLEDLLASSMEETVANNRHAGLLLWMAAMGAWAATQNAPSANEGEEDQPGEQILLQRTTLWQELVRALGINTLDAFRAHMLSFLWVEQSCSYFLSSMWESMNGSVYEIVDDYQAKSVHV